MESNNDRRKSKETCLTFTPNFTPLSGNGMSLRWHHNGHDGVWNQPNHCLLKRLFWRRSKKPSKLRVTGLCVGNDRGPVNSPHTWPATRKMFPFDDVIMGRPNGDQVWAPHRHKAGLAGADFLSHCFHVTCVCSTQHTQWLRTTPYDRMICVAGRLLVQVNIHTGKNVAYCGKGFRVFPNHVLLFDLVGFFVNFKILHCLHKKWFTLSHGKYDFCRIVNCRILRDAI